MCPKFLWSTAENLYPCYGVQVRFLDEIDEENCIWWKSRLSITTMMKMKMTVIEDDARIRRKRINMSSDSGS